MIRLATYDELMSDLRKRYGLPPLPPTPKMPLPTKSTTREEKLAEIFRRHEANPAPILDRLRSFRQEAAAADENSYLDAQYGAPRLDASPPALSGFPTGGGRRQDQLASAIPPAVIPPPPPRFGGPQDVLNAPPESGIGFRDIGPSKAIGPMPLPGGTQEIQAPKFKSPPPPKPGILASERLAGRIIYRTIKPEDLPPPDQIPWSTLFARGEYQDAAATAKTNPVKAREMLQQEMIRRSQSLPGVVADSLSSGVGQFQTGVGNALRFLGSEETGKELVETGKTKQEFYAPKMEDLSQTKYWSAQMAQNFPTAIGLMGAGVLAGMATGIGGAIAGLGTTGVKAAGWLGGSSFATFMESAMEAGQTYDDLVTMGADDTVARERAHNAFSKNLATIGVTNALEYAVGFMFLPKPMILGIIRRLGRVGAGVLKVLTQFVTEGGQEVGQEVFQRQSQELNKLDSVLGGIKEAAKTAVSPRSWDDELKTTFVVGGAFATLLGAATGDVGVDIPEAPAVSVSTPEAPTPSPASATPSPTASAAPPTPSELWSVPQTEAINRIDPQWKYAKDLSARDAAVAKHKELVAQALSEGKTVPDTVLAAYPDLKRQAKQAAKKAAAPKPEKPAKPPKAEPVKEETIDESDAEEPLTQEATDALRLVVVKSIRPNIADSIATKFVQENRKLSDEKFTAEAKKRFEEKKAVSAGEAKTVAPKEKPFGYTVSLGDRVSRKGHPGVYEVVRSGTDDTSIFIREADTDDKPFLVGRRALQPVDPDAKPAAKPDKPKAETPKPEAPKQQDKPKDTPPKSDRAPRATQTVVAASRISKERAQAEAPDLWAEVDSRNNELGDAGVEQGSGRRVGSFKVAEVKLANGKRIMAITNMGSATNQPPNHWVRLEGELEAGERIYLPGPKGKQAAKPKAESKPPAEKETKAEELPKEKPAKPAAKKRAVKTDLDKKAEQVLKQHGDDKEVAAAAVRAGIKLAEKKSPDKVEALQAILAKIEGAPDQKAPAQDEAAKGKEYNDINAKAAVSITRIWKDLAASGVIRESADVQHTNKTLASITNTGELTKGALTKAGVSEKAADAFLVEYQKEPDKVDRLVAAAKQVIAEESKQQEADKAKSGQKTDEKPAEGKKSEPKQDEPDADKKLEPPQQEKQPPKEKSNDGRIAAATGKLQKRADRARQQLMSSLSNSIGPMLAAKEQPAGPIIDKLLAVADEGDPITEADVAAALKDLPGVTEDDVSRAYSRINFDTAARYRKALADMMPVGDGPLYLPPDKPISKEDVRVKVARKLEKLYSGLPGAQQDAVDSNEYAEAEQLAVEAVTDLVHSNADYLKKVVRRGKAYVHGGLLHTELINKGRALLKGRKFRTMRDLIMMAQVYRDPRFETTRWIYVKDDVVVGEQAFSFGLPRVTPIHSKRDWSELSLAIKDYAAQKGADKVYHFHNHPSGSVVPSGSDLGGARTLNVLLGKLYAGDFIIDHGQYTVLKKIPKAYGAVMPQTVQFDAGPDLIKTPKLKHEVVGKFMNQGGGSILPESEFLSHLASKINRPEDHVTIFYVNNDPTGVVTGVESIHIEDFVSYEEGAIPHASTIDDLLLDGAKSHGGSHPVAYYSGPHSESVLQAAYRLIASGSMLDLVVENRPGWGRRFFSALQDHYDGHLPGGGVQFGRDIELDEDLAVSAWSAESVAARDRSGEAGFIRLSKPDTKAERLAEAAVLLGSEKVAQAVENAKGIKPPNWQDKAKAAWDSVVRHSTRAFEHLPNKPEFADFKERLKRIAKGKGIASDKAVQLLYDVTSKLAPGTRAYDLFRLKVVVDNELDNLWEQRLNKVPESKIYLHFGFTPDKLIEAHKRLTTALAASPSVEKIVQERKAMIQKVAGEYMDAMEDATGMRPNLARENYFRQQVIAYANAKNPVKGTGERMTVPLNRSFNKKRFTSKMGAETEAAVDADIEETTSYDPGLDYNTEYLQAEHEVLAQMIYDTEVAKLWTYVRQNFDVTAAAKLKAKELGLKGDDWKRLIPKEYQMLQPVPGNSVFSAWSVPEGYVRQAMKAASDVIEAPLDKAKKVRVIGGKRMELAVPKEIKDTLHQIMVKQPPTGMDAALRQGTRWYKQWALGSPRRVLGYGARNFTGDLDAVIQGNPSTVLEMKRSFHDLWDYFHNNKTDPMLEEWLQRGGLHGLFQNQDEDFNVSGLRAFKRIMDEKSGWEAANPVAIWNKYWSLVKDVGAFRESLLRYAAFRDYHKQITGSKDGRPKNWGASKRENVMALKDDFDKAYMLSNDLLGAYDEISVAGQYLRDHWMPFWSFQEVNFKRQKQIFANAWNDGDIATAVGRKLVSTAVRSPLILYRIGKMALKATLFWSIIQAWNRLMFPDEEKDMPEDMRGKAYLIFGRDEDGRVRYFSRLGVVGDFLEWFGADDAGQHYRDLLNNRKSIKDVAWAMAKAPANKLWQSIGPLKLVFETATGSRSFPDVFDSGQSRDRWETLASAFGVQPEYKALRGRPSRGYVQEGSRVFFTYTDPLESDYFEIRNMKAGYLDSLGMGGSSGDPSDKADSLYYVKQAARYGDYEAFQKYLLEYASLGGKKSGLQQSVDSLHPLSGMNKALKKDFITKLPEEDRQKLKRAMEHYEKNVKSVSEYYKRFRQERASGE